jgi:hypothetical protein
MQPTGFPAPGPDGIMRRTICVQCGADSPDHKLGPPEAPRLFCDDCLPLALEPIVFKVEAPACDLGFG